MFKRIPAMAAMDNAVSVIDVPATVKVNPSPNPSPHTKITPVIIKFLDFILDNITNSDSGNHTVKHKADTTNNGRWHRTDNRRYLWNKADNNCKAGCNTDN